MSSFSSAGIIEEKKTPPFHDHIHITIWSWEKEWVEMLANSWLNREKIIKHYMTLSETKPFMKKDYKELLLLSQSLKISYTLYLHFAIKYAQV